MEQIILFFKAIKSTLNCLQSILFQFTFQTFFKWWLVNMGMDVFVFIRLKLDTKLQNFE